MVAKHNEKENGIQQQLIGALTVDILQNNLFRNELIEKNVMLRSFLDASPDLFYLCDENHQFLQCNRAMERLTGRSINRIIGLTPWQIFSKETAQKMVASDCLLFQENREVCDELWLSYTDGCSLCFTIRKIPLYQRNGAHKKYLVGFGRDVTKYKQEQEALAGAVKERDNLLSTLSHEVLNPLNGITGLSNILLDSNLNREQLNHIKTIHTTATTINDIFKRLVPLENGRSHEVRSHPSQLELDDFLSEITGMAIALIGSAKINFLLQCSPSLPQRILIDATLLRQILWNLIGNAIKFTPEGQISLKVETAEDGGPDILFEVQDSGVGIKLSEQDKIFAMHYQASPADLKRRNGKGIGLAISQQMAHVMGGKITLNSKSGEGSCFKLRVHAPAISVANKLELKIESQESVNLEILLIEDVALNVAVAKAMLIKLGSKVDVANTGSEAMDLFRPGRYQLILLDMQLEDMTGFELAHWLRQEYQAEDLPPIIALTADLTQGRERYLAKGFDDFLAKPLSPSELRAALLRHQSTTSIRQNKCSSTDELCKSFDVKKLEQYLELFGTTFILNNLALLSRTMPTYLNHVKMALRDQNGDELSSHIHKIKSALGSMGLQKLRTLAEKVEVTYRDEEWGELEELVNQLSVQWPDDVKKLKLWIGSRNETEDPARKAQG